MAGAQEVSFPMQSQAVGAMGAAGSKPLDDDLTEEE